MKKGIIFVFFIVLGLFFASKMVFAIFVPQFGGRIVSTSATPIEELENMGYECYVPGYTITIRPIGSPLSTPTTYFIPFSTRSKTGNNIHDGQLIIGKYGGKQTISCTLAGDPPLTTTVSLDTINLFGNSR